MKTTVNNYSWFYSLLKKMSTMGDSEELKRQLVWQFSHLRTDSLREIRQDEYNEMCRHMQALVEKSEGSKRKPALSADQLEMKRARSAVLKRIQKIGIDTTDWANVDNFCLNPRIAGKVFRKIDQEELEALVPKLEAILSKPVSLAKLLKHQLN